MQSLQELIKSPSKTDLDQAFAQNLNTKHEMFLEDRYAENSTYTDTKLVAQNKVSLRNPN
jgi:hypothetical protein